MKSLSNAFASNGLVLIGKVTGAHGIKGAVKIVAYTDTMDLFSIGRKMILKDADGYEKVFTIIDIGAHKNILRISFDGVESRDQAENLIGFGIFEQRASFPDLDEETYYWVDLIGLSVYTCEGEYLGQLSSIMNTGSNDVYVIEGKENELLIPALKSVIHEVNLEHKIMKVNLPDGLR